MSNQGGKQGGNAKEPMVHTVYKGIVKQVLSFDFGLLFLQLFNIQITSGDCIVIRNSQAKDGKFLEKQVMLSHITAPRLARRQGAGGQPDEVDQVINLIFLNSKN